MVVEDVISDIETLMTKSSDNLRTAFESDAKLLLGLDQRCVKAYQAKLMELLNSGQSEQLWSFAKLICLHRRVEPDATYCMAELVHGSTLNFYSVVSYRRGIETRVPRHLSGDTALQFKHKHGIGIVVDRFYEAQAWLLRWEGHALLRGNILQQLIDKYY